MKSQAQRIGESDLSAARNEFVVPSPAARHLDFPRSKELTPIAVTVKQAAPLPDVTATRTGLTHGLKPDTLRLSNATTKRKGKSMSRRRGQAGHIEKSGKWFVVRYWQDIPGQEKRALKRERICPVIGPGSLSASARERRAKELIAASGVDSKEHFDRVVKVQTGVTMREQADAWYSLMSNPRRVGKNGRRTALSTLDSWKGIVESIKTELGGIPLSALVQNQQPVADFVTKLVNGGKGPKTVKNYFFVVKAIVASAKDVSTRKPLYPVAWDNEVLLMPRVNPKKQHRPTFTAAQVSQIVERVKGVYKMLFIVLAATGLRIGEAIGLKVENVLDGCYRLRIVEKNYAGRQEDFLKTDNGERFVELHSSVAKLLREHIGTRTQGFVFENEEKNALCASNILKRYLHPVLVGDDDTKGVTGKKAGEHAFRRFRDGHLRSQRCPSGLVKYWIGHSRNQDMSDLYDGSVNDEAYRMEIAEEMGIGFDLPVSCTDCTEKEKEATGAVASK
jgi:integrase